MILKKGFTYILVFLFITTSVVSSFYTYNVDNVSVLVELPQEEENNKAQNEEIKYLSIYHNNIEYNYSMLQETKFALFKRLPNDEDHSSPLEFPPETI